MNSLAVIYLICRLSAKGKVMQSQMKSPTLSAMNMMAKYAPKLAEKAEKESSLAKVARVSIGNLFIQPSGGKDSKPLNYSYCYYGINDQDGNFIAGFNMSNKAMLMAVHQGALSQDFLVLFEAYATKYAGMEIIKGM